MSGRFALLLVLCCTLVGCGGGNSNKEVASPSVALDTSGVLLAEAPKDARGILDVNKNAKDGDTVTVVGRVGGYMLMKPVDEGRASFTIVDTSFKPCNERGDDGCETPWDYCCDEKADVNKGSLFVKFVDDAGATLTKDAKSWLGVAPLKTVIVEGQLKREGSGAVLVARKIFVK